MAWDTARTRALLIEAAAAEFSEHGLAGGRVDRIATAAGVNKERIYSYFGSKEGLFAAALADQLSRTVDAVPIGGEDAEAIVDYAGRVFDHLSAHPELARLTFWEGLELGSAVESPLRAERIQVKIDAVTAAVPQLSRDRAAQLLFTILTLADGYQALRHMARLHFPDMADDEERMRARRAAVLSTVRAILAAETS
ncbi:TetR/AcrR family transcriptional regulator [Protaetiibacter intestinalis]|uniref:TetR/AcrR family transcriptional regulator n=1 Tax=Protaetiibacter intestinalis TaxID=2419774 RepID=A0A387BBH4_9MICO|nr:TetR family transcriptional regulator [Protaetiibacter intestinalis]AYF98309.1 TetR/AcrR family transcriptional regulator [Protaetiibacter intestinalis]